MPTVKIIGKYRFHFFGSDCNENRRHIHVQHPGHGAAKFWLEPEIELSVSIGLNRKELNKIQALIRDNVDEFLEAWDNFCRG